MHGMALARVATAAVVVTGAISGPSLAASASAPSTSTAAALRCQIEIRHLLAGGRSPPVDTGCWRVGPILIGMPRNKVDSLLGPADLQIDDPPATDPAGPHRTAIYVFPRDLAARLLRKPVAAVDFRLLEIDFEGDRVARIGNDQGYALQTSRCGPSNSDAVDPPDASEAPPADFRPFTRFAGVYVGESLRTLHRQLGRQTTLSTAGDFYTYVPAPITFHVEPARPGGVPEVLGFAIGSDERTVFLAHHSYIRLDRDPVSCRFRGYSVLAHAPHR